ncbi:MAG: carboxypeptidase regulatory-like domain-containing protein, partial [Fimbriimonadales bacterium]
ALTIIGDGAIPHPNVLGAFIRSDTLGRNTTYGNLYDIWRVQCRNPITPSVLASYLPRTEREPINLVGGFRDKLHAPRMIMWASPYTGNVWAGKGHILDPEVQTLLRNFLNQSGRMLMSGQDIAWALSLRGGTASQFLAQTLRAQYESDTAADVVIGPYQGLRRQLVSDGLQAENEDPNPIPNNPGGIGIWIRIEGGASQLDPPVSLRISHPGQYVITPTGDFFDVIPPVGAGSGPLYTDAAWNQVWLDSLVVDPPTAAPYRYQPNEGNPPLQLRAGSYYVDSGTRSKVVFLSFGLEGVNSAYNDTGIPGLLWCRSQRNKVLHNAFAWMTHGVVQGVVRQYNPDTNSYTPLPRALVKIIGLTPQSVQLQEVGYAITDSNGFYRIVGIEAGTYVVDAERPGFRTQHPEVVTIVANTATVNLIMLATPPGQISGRVVDINGQPVRYALVRATNTTDPEIVREILSDIDGTFLIPRVPAGSYDVTVVSVAGDNYTLPPAQPTPDGVFRNVQVVGGQTAQLPSDFVLEPLPGTVSGVVRDADTSEPIAGARVTATIGTITRADVTTDGTGAYSFEVPAGQYVITATAPGYAPGAQTVTVPSEDTITVDFALSKLPPGSISGRVVRRFGGAPEPGVLIEVLFNTAVVATTTTDSNGNYSLSSVPPGNYVVRPSKTGFTFIPATRTITVNPSQNTAVPNFQSEPLRTFFRGRFLVSAPYDYTTDVKALLDVPATSNFRFFGWDADQARYLFHPNPAVSTFRLGRGYFIETDEDLPLATEGTPAPNAPFQINLKRGWNLIGNPFLQDVNWDGVQFIDPDTSATISLPTAVGKQLVANALWGYSFGSYIATRRMKVWEGYWVYAFRDVTLVIPPTAVFTSAAASRSVANAGMGWRLTIEAVSGDALDRAYVGVSRSATSGYDNEHDMLKPPALSDNAVRITMPRLDWGAVSGDYGVDIQPMTRSASWEFVVETDTPNREVTLRWPDIQQMPRSANLVLVNLQTGERRFLRTTGSYTFRSSGVSRFRLEMASSGGLLRINNLQVTSGRGNQHTVAFNLTGDASVQVNIVAGGKVVRSLMNQASRSAGLQQVSWDGRDQNGIALPPGSYTVEIRATSEDGQTARAVTTLILTR